VTPRVEARVNRPAWDETWLRVAEVIGRRSLCSRAKIGAVIVSRDNSRTWVGYNNPARGFDHGEKSCIYWCSRAQRFARYSPYYDDCPSVHAEANALMKADRELCLGGTIYTTGDVCSGCAKLIANSGLETVVVLSDAAEHRSPAEVYAFLERCGITVVTIERTGRPELVGPPRGGGHGAPGGERSTPGPR